MSKSTQAKTDFNEQNEQEEAGSQLFVTAACCKHGSVEPDSISADTGKKDDQAQDIDESDFTFSEPSPEMLELLQEMGNS